MNRLLGRTILLAATLLIGMPGFALRLPRTMGEILSRTDTVVTGTVVKSDGLNFTLRVDDVLFGDKILSGTVQIRTPRIGCIRNANVVPDSTVLACLQKNPQGKLEITGDDVMGLYALSAGRYKSNMPEYARLHQPSFRPDELIAVLQDRSRVRAEIISYLQQIPDLSAQKIQTLRENPPPELRKFIDRSKLYLALCDEVLVQATNFYYAKERGLTENDKNWIAPDVWTALEKK